MLVLGIESSCDETALALVQDGKILEEVLFSQAGLHAIFGGVVPELASRGHIKYIGFLFDKLIDKAKIRLQSIDAIAVTRGPGLLGSLLVGAGFAKALAFALGIRIIGINHLYAHALANGINHKLEFPSLAVVVSGGHTHLYCVEAVNKFIQIGRTLDDAAGEVFDKVGTLIGFEYPAGKHIDICAANGKNTAGLLPKPYLDNDNLDFSFSGLKTAAHAVLNAKGLVHSKDMSNAALADFCATFNETVSDILYEKISRALSMYPKLRQIWLAGGVAANSAVRKKIEELALYKKKTLFYPETRYCTDNASMIAYTGWLLAEKGYYHNLDFEVIPRGKKIPDDMLISCNAPS